MSEKSTAGKTQNAGKPLVKTRGKRMENKNDKPDYADQFERKFFEMVTRDAEAAGITWSELSRRVAKGRSDKRRMLYAVKGTTTTGRPQRIRLSDAYRMVEALGKNFPEYMLYVNAEMNLKADNDEV